MRMLVSTLRKLIRRPASWVTLGLQVGLLTLILVSVGLTFRQLPVGASRLASEALLSFPAAYLLVLSFVLGLGGLLSMVYGAAVAGSEWSWGTLRNAVARGESRWRYIAATYLGVAALLAAGLAIVYVAGLGATLIASRIAGLPGGGLDDATVLGRLPEQLARGWVVLAEQGAVGFAIATLARSQLAGIGVGIGLFFGEQFATIFLPDVVRYLPFHVANAAVDLAGGGIGGGTGAGAGGGGAGLTPDQALGLAVAWLVGSIAVACAFTDRAEIGG